MHITLSHLGTTSCYTEVRTDAWTTTKKRTVHMSSLHDSNTSVPHNGIRLLSWFSSLYKGNVSHYNVVVIIVCVNDSIHCLRLATTGYSSTSSLEFESEGIVLPCCTING